MAKANKSSATKGKQKPAEAVSHDERVAQVLRGERRHLPVDAATVHFRRWLRTGGSEQWGVFCNAGLLGVLDLHLGRDRADGTLAVHFDLTPGQVADVADAVRDLLVDGAVPPDRREDFRLAAYRTEFAGDFSDHDDDLCPDCGCPIDPDEGDDGEDAAVVARPATSANALGLHARGSNTKAR